jgi:mannose-6-phosphate isomerase-like protein (cupin superfamily)
VTDALRGYALARGEGLGGHSALKISATSSGGSLSLIESHTDGGAPPHVHEREDEAMYVLEGRIVVHVGTEEFHVDEGGFVFMPRGILHDWDVEGDMARVLIMAAPGGLERFLGEFHAAADWPARDEVAARYGLTFPR